MQYRVAASGTYRGGAVTLIDKHLPDDSRCADLEVACSQTTLYQPLLLAANILEHILGKATLNLQLHKLNPSRMQNLIHTFIDPLRDRFAPLNHTSNFRTTGQLTPEEFQAAGDFLVYKFPSWSWADAATPDKRVSYFPAGKQYLITRGVPCKRRVKGGDKAFLGDGEEEQVVRDMLAAPGEGEAGGEDDGWLKAGGGGAGMGKSAELRMRDVRVVDDDGDAGEKVEQEEEIPDMEDEEDDEEAIIRDSRGSGDSDGYAVTHSSFSYSLPY